MEIENENVPVISTGEWVLTYLIAAIPIVGLVMLFVWAFGSETNPNKANWAKAALIWTAIVIGIYIVFAMAFGAAILASLGGR
jgi:heme/copper-type cytochrome/quinol oxidase subunit 2